MSQQDAKPDSKIGFAKGLVAWYHKNHRDLPWRNTNDPYAIWLSEIMLQQTQVVTVIPYYHRFLERFPNIEALATAPEDSVLKAWEGLGYYARARNLQKAAQQIMERHQDQFPETIEEVEALSGIGRSTAGAILTFAKGQSHPLLDGNVKRVLSRLFDVAEDINQPKTLEALWSYSEALLKESTEPYAYNQATMELGATLCTPKNPSCLVCPVQEWCDSAKAGTAAERPVKAAKKPVKHHHIGAAVIWNDGKILIQQRPKEGLLGGLWEFPGGKQEPGEAIETTVVREIQEELGLTVVVHNKIAAVKHAYTHFKITLHAFHCQYQGGVPTPQCADDWAWVLPERLRDYPFPKANHPVIEAILAGHSPEESSNSASNTLAEQGCHQNDETQLALLASL